jgi:hypothetical protein
MSTIFACLEEKHPIVRAISLVDDKGFLSWYNNLDESMRELERVACHAIGWGDSNEFEFEISKTEVLLFSRQSKVLQAAKESRISIGEKQFSIDREATRWLSFWLDSKPSFKTHFEKRLTNAKAALQRIKGLSKSNSGLSVRLMRQVPVAAVNSVALYGVEVG